MKQLQNKSRSVGMSCLGILLLILLSMICCPATMSSDTFATLSSNSEINSGLQSSVSVAISDQVDLVANFGQGDSEFVTGTASVSIGTSNVSNYKVYLHTTNGTQDLVPTTAGVTQTIGPVNGSMTAMDYADNMNKWGYNIARSTASVPPDYKVYKPVPATDTLIHTNSNPDLLNYYSLYIAMAVDTSLPSGDYTNGITLSVVAEPTKPTATFPSSLTTMQGMTSEICAAAEEGATARLTDTRDNNTYKVVKLADGNCWMTENLAFKLTTAGIKVEDSDTTIAWGTSANYRPTATLTSINESNTNVDYSNSTLVRSWNTDSNYGTYYTYNAATAGQGGSITASGQSATRSVCPKNWRLPTSGSKYNNVSGSFYYLFDKYGANTGTIKEQLDIITSEPLNFKYGGYVDVVSGGGGLVDVEKSGTYWSSVSHSETSAYYAFFDDTRFGPSFGADRVKGRNVRCLAR